MAASLLPLWSTQPVSAQTVQTNDHTNEAKLSDKILSRRDEAGGGDGVGMGMGWGGDGVGVGKESLKDFLPDSLALIHLIPWSLRLISSLCFIQVPVHGQAGV